MKNNKFCGNVDQIDICGQIVSTLHQNGIEFIWQLVLTNDECLIHLVGACSTRLIRSGLTSFLEGLNSESLINFVELFLKNKISDFPNIYSLVDHQLEDKSLVYLFDECLLSEAKKNLNNILNEEVTKFLN
jgi:tetrahydromethanopterin S-methyltransferase subunit A